jgi:hypothetical protein
VKQFILNYFGTNVGALTFQEIILNFLVAGILSVVIFLSYRISHSGVVYSARFNITLVILTLVTTLVMNVIGNNIALSLGMVGALSIVRFRTAIKDPRDTTYIFWGIAVGICCGVQEYLISSLGTGIIFLFMLGFGAVKNNNRFLLIVRGDRSIEKPVRQAVERLFNNRARMCVLNSSENSIEFIWELARKEVDAAQNSAEGGPVAVLDGLEGVRSVSLVEQNDEVNQ